MYYAPYCAAYPRHLARLIRRALTNRPMDTVELCEWTYPGQPVNHWCPRHLGSGAVLSNSHSLAMFAAIRRASSLGEQVGLGVRPRLIFYTHWAVGSRGTGAVSAKGARYEDVCVDHPTAFGGLAGRSAAPTGPWCRRPDKQFDPSKHRPYMYSRNGCDFLQPTRRPEQRGPWIEHRVFWIERQVWNERRLRIERRVRSWCRIR
jgi:hypothetical protein